ncbi:putative F-box/LRR-repeat protein At3g28410 isoform X2 [Lactuca sativa]|uniref:putative F-box/LRR-repeat protein At3g28410 isoform X2 n=1 Tax=Lactuca sativa TaxID=4236 RepID=UPI001C692889|nr:putative F-box/LRR-repeat protein At3g28410 isoform X2 [Lactuca sativa]
MEIVEEGQNQPKIERKQRKSQKIIEKGEDDRIYSLPDCLLLEILSRLPTTKHSIRTEDCVFTPTGAISWKNLRSLCISSGKLNEDLIENILSGSPVLETLELKFCNGFRRINITSKSVKKLVLSGYMDSHNPFDAHTIEINAPNILSLTIEGNLWLWNLLLLNVSSLAKVSLNYVNVITWHIIREETEDEMFKELY